LATLFRENGIDYEKVDYFIEALTGQKLRDLLKKAGLRPIEAVRKKEAVFKELSLSDNAADDELINAMVRHPQLLQRPIVEVGDRAVLARPVERALELIKGISK
jgi:arsenate reductase